MKKLGLKFYRADALFYVNLCYILPLEISQDLRCNFTVVFRIGHSQSIDNMNQVRVRTFMETEWSPLEK